MRCLSLTLAALALCVTNGVGQDAPTRVVIPFDFESKFDDGRYGQMIGDLVWSKLKREGGFILPESMQDVRDGVERRGMLPGPETPLDQLAKIVRGEEAAQLAIWGKVERVAGQEFDEYDLWIKVADFSSDPPRLLYDKQARTRTVSEIPHLYVKEALEKLYGRADVAIAPGSRPATPGGGEAIASSLVTTGFEAGQSAPEGWDPLSTHVSWVRAEGAGSDGKVIRFTIPPAVAESTGVLYYSAFFPVEEGATYQFRCRWRSTAPAAKVFVKAYDEMPGPFRAKTAEGSGLQKREVYRSQQNLTGAPGTWNVQVENFTPKHSQFHPKWARVMLYAYYPAGVVEWDDVEVRLVRAAAKP
jgi:hypothetical protein